MFNVKRNGGRMVQREVGPILILVPQGYLTGDDETTELKRVIISAAQDGNTELIINLEDVDHLNSTAHGVLGAAHVNWIRRGGAMRLCCAQRQIRQVFTLTGLDKIFNPVYATEQLAIASFAE